eukprot:1226415-Amphidinium_carterae.1
MMLLMQAMHDIPPQVEADMYQCIQVDWCEESREAPQHSLICHCFQMRLHTLEGIDTASNNLLIEKRACPGD